MVPIPGSDAARRVLFLACVCTFLGALWPLASDPACAAPKPGVSSYLDDVPLWIEAVGTGEEARVYRGLRTWDQRERFLVAFWRARGLHDLDARGGESGPGASSWDRARRMHLRFLDARVRFDDLSSAQARTYLQAGAPAREVVFGGCRSIVRPVRMWWYDEHQAADLVALREAPNGAPNGAPSEAPGSGFWRVFVRDYAHPGDFKDWWPGDGIEALSEDDAPFARSALDQVLSLSRDGTCFRKGEEEARVLEEALQTAWSPERLGRLLRARAPDASWLDDFADSVLDADPSSTDSDRVFVDGASLDLRAAGSDRFDTAVRGRFTVPVGVLHRNGAGRIFDRLTVRGEARVAASVVDGFEHVFHVVGRPRSGLGGSGAADAIELDVFRRLRPGAYSFRFRLEDGAGRALLTAERRVRVPRLDAPMPRPGGHPMGLAGLTRDRVSTLVTFPEIQIVSPGSAQVGEVALDVRATGGRAARRIDRVDVWLDGRAAGSDDEAPWRVLLDLGDEPTAHAVQAAAFDAEGRELSRDALRLDPGPRPFRVALRLTEPSEQAEASVRRRAEVQVVLPRGLEPAVGIERVEIRADGGLLAAFRKPPYRVELPPAVLAGAEFVRAVAVLEDGRSAEDFVFLRGQGAEFVDVRLVEVWATVLDARDRPVTHLVADDFRVLDEGEAQPLRRVDMVTDLPIRVALLMDTSTSMREKLPVAVASARRFFDDVVTPRDSAAFLTFDHRLRLRTPFTADRSRLALGAGGLEAAGGTRLHDALVWSLGYLGGDPPGAAPSGRETERRALVVLSDGRDVGSAAPFEEALEQAVESGIAVYSILLAVGDAGTRSDLVRIARESGGAAYEIDDAGDLDWVYRRIEEELRSQYLLVYASPGTRRGTFHRIEVQLERPGLTARSVRGYYR